MTNALASFFGAKHDANKVPIETLCMTEERAPELAGAEGAARASPCRVRHSVFVVACERTNARLECEPISTIPLGRAEGD